MVEDISADVNPFPGDMRRPLIHFLVVERACERQPNSCWDTESNCGAYTQDSGTVPWRAASRDMESDFFLGFRRFLTRAQAQDSIAKIKPKPKME